MGGNQAVFQEALRKGHNFAWDHNWTQAIREYRRAAAEIDSDPLLWISLGVALAEARRLPEARDAYSYASALRPNDIALQQKLAELYELTGDKENALRVHLDVATALEKAGAPARALDAWNAILRLQPLHVESRAHVADLLEALERPSDAARENAVLARLLRERGRSTEAAARARHALQLDTQNVEARAFIESLEGSEQPSAPAPAARPARLVAAESNPATDMVQATMRQIAHDVIARRGSAASNAEQDALIARALENHARRQVRQAIDLYSRALAAGVNEPAVHYNLGMLLLETLQRSEAAREFEQSVHSPALALASEFALGCCYVGRDSPAARDHLLAAYRSIDSDAAKGAQAGQLAQQYQELGERCRSFAGGEAVEQVSSLIEFLSGREWQTRVSELRAKLDMVAREGEVLTIAEAVTARHAGEMLDALAASQTHLKHHLPAAAAEECYRGIDRAPTYLPLHAQLAQVYLEQGRVEAAVEKFAAIAAVHRVRGEPARAQEYQKQIVQYAPDNQAVRAELIQALITSGDRAGAIDHYLAAAEAYARESMSAQALDACDAALKLIPQAGPDRWTSTCLHLMGDIFVQRTAWKEALACYTRLTERDPDDAKGWLRLVDMNFKLGRSDQTVQALDRLSAVYERSGESEQLVPIVSDMALTQPDNTVLRTYLIDLLEKLDRKPQAVAELDALGEIQLGAGQTREAIRSIERIISLRPANEEDYRALLAQLQQSI